MATSAVASLQLPQPDCPPTWTFNTLFQDSHNLRSSPPTSPTVQRQSTMERRSSILGSLKNKFSRKAAATPNDNPLAPRSPATRRPNRPGMNAFTTPSTEPPPAYTPRGVPATEPALPQLTPNLAALQPHAQQPTVSGSNLEDDDRYAFLNSFDTVFLIDDSGSMAGRSWRECTAALEAITPICTAHDADGIDLYFLNAPDLPVYRNVTSASTVHEIFNTVRPQGGTPTGQKLNRILRDYLRQLEDSPQDTKPLNVIVITDGAPADDVESVLIWAAQKLDKLDAEPWQVGVQFFQVGEEQGAREHLVGLDDELSRMGGGCRDIVDTVPFVPGERGRGIGLSADGILKVVLGAVNKRLDRRRNSSELQ